MRGGGTACLGNRRPPSYGRRRGAHRAGATIVRSRDRVGYFGVSRVLHRRARRQGSAAIRWRVPGRKPGSEFCCGRADRNSRCRGMIIDAVPGGTYMLRCNLRGILESKGTRREMPQWMRRWLVTDDDCAMSRYNGVRRAVLHCTVARLPAHGLAAAAPLAAARVSVPATTPIPWEDD